jgi:hypothetical protein
MTLRDIGNWFDEVGQTFLRDLEIVFTAPVVDWPLYIVFLAFVVAIFVFSMIGAIIAVPLIGFTLFWDSHFDHLSRPTTKLGHRIHWTLEVLTLVSYFILIWFFVFVVSSILALAFGFEQEGPGTGYRLMTLVPPTVISGVIVYLVVRGRKAEGTKENTINSS